MNRHPGWAVQFPARIPQNNWEKRVTDWLRLSHVQAVPCTVIVVLAESTRYHTWRKVYPHRFSPISWGCDIIFSICYPVLTCSLGQTGKIESQTQAEALSIQAPFHKPSWLEDSGVGGGGRGAGDLDLKSSTEWLWSLESSVGTKHNHVQHCTAVSNIFNKLSLLMSHNTGVWGSNRLQRELPAFSFWLKGKYVIGFMEE